MEFDFDDLALIEVPVKIAGKEYLLREASGEDARIYNNARMQGVQMEGEKILSLPEDSAGIPSLLVSRCLWETKDGKATVRVALNKVRGFPSRIIGPLFEKAKEISGLEDDTEETISKQMSELRKRLERIREQEKVKNVLQGTDDGCESQIISVPPTSEN